MSVSSGRNFLHTPGPTNIPERVLRAMLQPAVDFTDPDFLAMTQSCFADLKKVFRTESEVICDGHLPQSFIKQSINANIDDAK